MPLRVLNNSNFCLYDLGGDLNILDHESTFHKLQSRYGDIVKVNVLGTSYVISKIKLTLFYFNVNFNVLY